MRDLVKNINSELINSSELLVQYREIKAQNKGYIVFFRVGEFYESYFDDASQVASACSIALGRKHFKFGDVYLAGMPKSAKESVVKKLLNKGYRVAICEEFDANSDGSILKRKIVQKFTAGVLFEEEFLNPDESNYLCAVSYSDQVAKLAFADVSTNQFYLTEISQDKVLDEILKFEPAEVLLCSDCYLSKKFQDQISNLFREINIVNLDKEFFKKNENLYSAQDNLALNAILNYLQDNSHASISNACFTFYKADNYLNLSFGALRNLEVLQNMQNLKKEGTLFWVLDKTKTPMGRRCLEHLLKFPLLSKTEILKRQSIISYFLENKAKIDFATENLSLIGDVSRLITRIKNNYFKVRDFIFLKNSISAISSLVEEFNSLCLFQFSESEILELLKVRDFLNNNISDDILNPINPMADSEFQFYINKIENISLSVEQYRSKLADVTQISKLKIFQFKNKFVIEIPRSQASKVPQDFLPYQIFSAKARYTTDELEKLSVQFILENTNKTSIIASLVDKISSYLGNYTDLILSFSQKIAFFDVMLAFSQVALAKNYVCPKISENNLSLEDAKHPSLSFLNSDFCPTSFEFSENLPDFILLTGANMAGKSTLMRQIALISIMAQAGSFVPAKSATLPIFDKIFVRFGVIDNIFKNKSSFALEMYDVKQILDNATKNSLILLDELGKSTSTQDGSAIARAVSEYIFNSIGAKTIFATHYHSLKDMCDANPEQVRAMAIFDRNNSRAIKNGFLDKSQGIKIAQDAGLPESIIQNALNYASCCQ